MKTSIKGRPGRSRHVPEIKAIDAGTHGDKHHADKKGDDKNGIP